MPSLDAFIDSLTQEKVKIIQIGTLKISKDHVLVSLESNNLNFKGNIKFKEKKPKSNSEDEGSTLLMKAQIPRRRGTRKEDQSVTIK